MTGYICFQRQLSTLSLNFCSNHLGSQGVRVSTTTTKEIVIITVPHCYDITQDTIVLMEELIQQAIDSATMYLLCEVMLYYYPFMKR